MRTVFQIKTIRYRQCSVEIALQLHQSIPCCEEITTQIELRRKNEMRLISTDKEFKCDFFCWFLNDSIMSTMPKWNATQKKPNDQKICSRSKSAIAIL